MKKYYFNDIVSFISTVGIYLIGGFDISFKLLVIVLILDYLTGISQAIYNKELNSKIGFKGLLKKLSYFILVMLAVIIDKLLNSAGTIRTLVIYFFIANDGISILENLGKMNVPIPKKILDVLEQLRMEGEE